VIEPKAAQVFLRQILPPYRKLFLGTSLMMYDDGSLVLTGARVARMMIAPAVGVLVGRAERLAT
jgi:hypothetical protein